MRVAIFITILFFSFNNCFGQTVYFSELQPEEWNTSLITNVEFSEGSYYVFGLFSTDDIPEGTFIQRFTTEGVLESTLLALDSVILPNYAENFNVYGDEIIFSGGRNILSVDFNGELNWSAFKEFPLLYGNDFVLSSKLESSNYLAIGSKIYNIDKDASPEFSNVYLLKVGLAGEELWEREFELFEDRAFRTNAIHELEDGRLILLGASNAGLGEWQPYIMRLTVEGNLIDYSSFGQEEENNWLPWSVLEEDEDRLTLVYQKYEGEDETFGDIHSLQIAQYDLTSDSFTYESDFSEGYLVHNVQDFIKTPDGGYAATGRRGSDFILKGFVTKYTSDLTIEWDKEYIYSLDYTNNYLYDIEVTPNGGFVCAGETTGQNINTHPQSSWLLKLDACGDVEWQGCDTTTVGIKEEIKLADLKLYPNPAKNSFTLAKGDFLVGNDHVVIIRNTLGQEVSCLSLTNPSTEIDISNLSLGMYLVSLVSDGRELYSQKLLVK
jgi:hypothetical protein